jgi:dihydroxy-acid dehydratase
MPQNAPGKEPSRFLDFRTVPYGTKRNGELVLNRSSSVITQGHEFPGAQAMLYAAGIETAEQLRTVPQVGMTRLIRAFRWMARSAGRKALCR